MPFPVAGRPHNEDGRVTRVRVAFHLRKLLQAAGDPRRGSAHHARPLSDRADGAHVRRHHCPADSIPPLLA